MTSDDLAVGAWYCSPTSLVHLLRYEGRNASGAYVFSRFVGSDPENHGEDVTTIEIYNVEELVPWKPRS